MTQEIPGYRITEKLHESAQSIIYLANREKDAKQVVIKMLRDDYPSRQQIARVRHEYNIHHGLAGINGVGKIYGVLNYGNKPALVLEYISGGEISAILQENSSHFLDLFFKSAIQITQALGEIHQQFIIHKDINPKNILWDANTETVKIIDFGIATELSREKQAQNTNLLVGSLPYMSPEQTGRMNRSIDYRADFYSLGATFYKLLTGELPFDVEEDDPMAWIHCHIAREIKPLIGFEPAVSSALSTIINKLMAKNAEDRYQSAFGIKNDLEFCYQQWRNTGAIIDFIPGLQDFSDHFEIQQKLYGREKERDELLEAFADITEGESRMFLVSGFSGIGKSALINEVHKPIVTQQGYFIVGKFDQFQRNIPYSAMARAFRGLMKQLLTEPPQRLQAWKSELLEVLGPNGQVLIDFIPELEQIIGPQPKVAHLGTEENQNRFNRLSLDFLQLFTGKERSLVMFIDDLQWVDSASLNLIKLFMLSKELAHFLFLGAYRNNEVDAYHPFMRAVDELQKAGVRVSNLVLQPLQLEHVNHLLSDSLHVNKQKSLPLAQLVLHKTAGNPFFINQFLKSIYETGLLTFDIKTKCWIWDLQRIKRQKSSDNVVDLVVEKMKSLPHATCDLLKLGACIGNVFDLHTLSIISERTLVQLAQELWPAVKSGLLLTEGDGHALLKGMEQGTAIEEDDFPSVVERFLHDRVQQAAYSLIEEEHKQQVHLKIGRLLLQKIPEQELENYYFDIVEHYNKSIVLLDDDRERCQLAELNLKAGKKAKEGTAYSPALQYFSQAALCLDKLINEQHDKLAFEIEKGQIECHFLLSDSEAGLKQAEKLLKKCTTIEDKVELNNILILYYGGAGEMDKAIDIALESLRYFAVDLPRNPSQIQLLSELARAKLNLGRRNVNELMHLPLIKDPNIQSVFSLLKELIAPTYLQGLTNLLPYIILRMFNLTLKHGNGPVASFAYSGYALLWAKLDDFALSYRFGVLAMEYNRKIANPPMEARCYFMTTSFALYWRQPFKDSQQPRKTGLQKLIDTGEYFWASYIYLFGFWQEVVLSRSLDELFELTEREILFARKANQIEPYYVHKLHRNLFKNLAGLSLNPGSLDVEQGEEAEAAAYFAKNITSTMGKFYHVVCRLVLHFNHEQYKQALAVATQKEITEEVIRDGTFTRVIYTFYSCLSILAVAGYAIKPNAVHKGYNKRKAKLKQWFTLFPENFACMWYLLLAEEERIESRDIHAIEYFEQALQAAKQNESLFFESLANELYAKFWLCRGNGKVAAVFMREAAYLYYRWGALGKLAFLEKKYPSLLANKNIFQENYPVSYDAEENSRDTLTTSTGGKQKESSLDLNTLAKASQTLSGEIVMEKLLQKLMHFLIENAGAQKGILILKEHGNFFIETECFVEHDQEVMHQQTVPLEKSDNLSITVVRYVIRSKEIVVLNDATNDKRFTADDYLHKGAIKSVFCLPLLDKGKLTGILYLENNLAYNSFTPDRVETLQVLSAEIAIALENARLYRNLEEYNQTLEEKVRERTTVLRSMNDALQNKNMEIQQSKEIIEEKNSNITKSIKYAQKIQQAMLPQSKKIAEELVDFFIIFRPKQIVSGDFYWFNNVDGKIFLIVADCTGHGVPGAFLSTIGNMLLNKIILEKRIFSPAVILGVLHEEVRAALRQEGKTRQANDGMDIVICRIDLNRNTLHFAGARRPLYLAKCNENKLLKIRGDRKSIGGRQKEGIRRFTDHVVNFSHRDMLYLTSDGFVDQHSQDNKKFGSRKLEEVLLNVAGKDAAKQKRLIIQALEKHQGTELQRDDITLIGTRLAKSLFQHKVISQENNMHTFDLLSFRQQIIENKIILSFEGKMSQGVLVALVDTLKEKLAMNEEDASQFMVRKIYAIFVELAQNIQNHSMEKVMIGEHGAGVGVIIIREDENHFVLSSGNNVLNADAQKLKTYCDKINKLDENDLKKLYKERLRTPRKEGSKGAGIGLIEIIRKSGYPLGYEMQAIDEHVVFFTLSVNLDKVS